jgi:hypothetical protein
MNHIALLARGVVALAVLAFVSVGSHVDEARGFVPSASR